MRKDLISIERIAKKILDLRGQKVRFDYDLALLYGIETRALKQAVRRNLERFPSDFMFELSAKEIKEVVSQFVIPSRRSRGAHAPRVLAMAPSPSRTFPALYSGLRHRRRWRLFGEAPRRTREARVVRSHRPMIAWTIYITFAAPLLRFCCRALCARWIALLATTGRTYVWVSLHFSRKRRLPIWRISPRLFDVPWVPALGMNYHLALDGISLTLVLVTGHRRLRAPCFFPGTSIFGLTSSSFGCFWSSAVPTESFSAPISFFSSSFTSW